MTSKSKTMRLLRGLRRSAAPFGLSASVAFFAALVVLGLGGWQMLRTRDAILHDAEQNIRNLTRALAQHAGRTAESVDLTLADVVEKIEGKAATNDVADFLMRRERTLEQARNLVVIDAHGDWDYDTAPAHRPLNSADRSYFIWHRDHADLGLHIDQPIVGRTSAKIGIPFSRRINAPDGSFDGVAVATLTPEYFEEFYKTVKVGARGTVALWTDDGRLLLRYPAVPDRTKPKQAAPRADAAAAFKNRSGVLRSRSPWDDVERFFAFEHVDKSALVVSAAVSIDDCLTDWQRDALTEALAIGSAAVALVILGIGLEAHRRRLQSVEAASREIDRQYRLLADNSYDLIVLKPSLGGVRAYVSPSARMVVGWEPEELAVLPTKIFVHPEDFDGVSAAFASLTPELPAVTIQHRVKHKAGYYIWIEAVFRRTEDGSVLVSARDVTARREAERALADSESRFRSLADTSSDMIQRLDLSGRRCYVSPAAVEIFGHDPAEMLGTHPVDFIHPDDIPRVGALIASLTTGQSDRARSVHRIRHKAGNFVWVEVQFRLVREMATDRPVEIVASVRDVTEREILQQQHAEANRLLRLAEEVAHVGHWRLELPSNALTWSKEVYRMHGVDPENFSPKVETAIDMYHPDDRAEVERCVSEALATRQSYEFQRRIRLPNGAVRHVLSRGLCEVGPTGTLTALFGTIMDVTELRQAELAATESEGRYRLLADNTTDMITHMDLAGRRLFVSPGSRELLGYDPGELVGTNPQEMIHPDDAPGLRSVFADLEHGRLERATNVNRLRHKDGRWIWVEASLKAIQDEGGRRTGFVGSIRNIMDRRLADEALRVSEARYRVLAETTTDVITQLDLSMHRQYVSPACHDVLGYWPEEMLGRRPSATIHPEEAATVRALAARLVAGEIEGDKTVTTYRALHKKGHWVWVEAGLNLVRDAAGAPASLICSLRDVTERQRVKRHLEKAAAAAEQAAQVKANFVANMSHELRTPLTGILGVHDLLQQDLSLSDAQRRLVGLASDASRSLLAIVNDVLDFSKAEAGQLTLESVPFDLDDLIASCRDLAFEGMKDKPIDIRTVLHPATPRRVLGDPTRIRQILLNLLTNAVKFTEQGHIVVNVGYTLGAGVLRIDVTDTGIGIPADRAAQLFDRFTQADTSVTRRFGGTGLGLAICKRLVDRMNGRIGAEAMPEGGSRFWFELLLPPQVEVVGGDHAVEDEAPAGAGRSLLLVEDNPVNSEIISAMLTAHGHAITAVTNGAEALDAIRSRSRFYDLVLMDLQMPVMDGLTATTAIRDHEATSGLRRLPIIGLTANALAEDAATCLAAGMDAHVAKPIVWQDLFAVIDQVLVHSAMRRSPTLAGAADRAGPPLGFKLC